MKGSHSYTLNLIISLTSLCSLPQKYDLKCVKHVQHDTTPLLTNDITVLWRVCRRRLRSSQGNLVSRESSLRTAHTGWTKRPDRWSRGTKMLGTRAIISDVTSW